MRIGNSVRESAEWPHAPGRSSRASDCCDRRSRWFQFARREDCHSSRREFELQRFLVRHARPSRARRRLRSRNQRSIATTVRWSQSFESAAMRTRRRRLLGRWLSRGGCLRRLSPIARRRGQVRQDFFARRHVHSGVRNLADGSARSSGCPFRTQSAASTATGCPISGL